MSFFRRKEPATLIPPVAEAAPRGGLPSGPRAGAGGLPSRPNPGSSYNASRDGDLSQGPPSYRSAPSYNPTPARGADYAPPAPVPARSYSRGNAVGDQYSRGEADVAQDRSELFSGYKPKQGSGRFFDAGPAMPDAPPPGEEGEDDVEGIKQQTRFVKQESVASTRNALRMAREAEETARNTMLKLGDQSEKLANTERHLDVAKGHSQKADDRTDELKQLNRSIFRPVITFNKDAKRRAKEQQIQDRFDEERGERERAMMDVRESQNRIGRATGYAREGEEELGLTGDDAGAAGGARGRFKSAEQQAATKAQRARYQFEATNSDDEMEDELDGNLDEIHDAVKRMKALGLAMGQEVDGQIKRIERIEDKTTNLDGRVFRNTEKLKRIK